jgi:hypothetical protein
LFSNEWANLIFARSLPGAFLPAFRAFPLSTYSLPLNAASDREENYLFLTILRKLSLFGDLDERGRKARVLGDREYGNASTEAWLEEAMDWN